MIITRIDNTLIVVDAAAVETTKMDLQARFQCEECGKLDKYFGSDITRMSDFPLKFTQPVILQSYNDGFDLQNQNFPPPATPGDVRKKCKKEDALGP